MKRHTDECLSEQDRVFRGLPSAYLGSWQCKCPEIEGPYAPRYDTAAQSESSRLDYFARKFKQAADYKGGTIAAIHLVQREWSEIATILRAVQTIARCLDAQIAAGFDKRE